MSFFSKLQEMPEYDIGSGILFITIAIYFFSRDWVNGALSLVLLGIALICSGRFRIKNNDSFPRFFWVLYMLMVLFLIFYFHNFMAKKMNQKMQRQEICGNIVNVKHEHWPKRFRKHSFELENANLKVKFDLEGAETYVYGPTKKLCIQYAHNPKWSTYPYIYEVRPDPHRY